MPSVLMKIGRSSLCRKLNLTMAVKTLGKDQKETRWQNVVRSVLAFLVEKPNPPDQPFDSLKE